MTLPRTFGDIIAERDFSGFETSGAEWRLDAEAIEMLLYDRSACDYESDNEQTDAFYKAEKTCIVEINTWLCTDQYVGLEVFVLNDLPTLLIWQTARKAERELGFISPFARDQLAARWEAHRPAPRVASKIVPRDIFALPIAPPGAKPLSIDTGSTLQDLTLSAHGAWQWLEIVKAEGGLDTVHDIHQLKHCLEAARRDVEQDRAAIERLSAQYAERPDIDPAPLEEYRVETLVRMNQVTEVLIEPIVARIDALTAEEGQ